MRISMVLAGLVAFSAVACGGSDDGGGKGGKGTTVSTSIPDDTRSADLTQAQTDELCSALESAGAAAFPESEVKAMGCRFGAWMQATVLNMPDKCEAMYDECMKAPADSEDPAVEDECTKPASTCMATVGELEACWTDLFAASKASFAQIPGCDDVGKEIDMDSLGEPALPASCKVVEEKCPEALDTAAQPELPIESNGQASDSAPPAPGENG